VASEEAGMTKGRVFVYSVYILRDNTKATAAALDLVKRMSSSGNKEALKWARAKYRFCLTEGKDVRNPSFRASVIVDHDIPIPRGPTCHDVAIDLYVPVEPEPGLKEQKVERSGTPPNPSYAVIGPDGPILSSKDRRRERRQNLRKDLKKVPAVVTQSDEMGPTGVG